jgi:hypothetical protein
VSVLVTHGSLRRHTRCVPLCRAVYVRLSIMVASPCGAAPRRDLALLSVYVRCFCLSSVFRFRSALLAVPPGLPGRRSLVHRSCQRRKLLRHNKVIVASHDFHCNIALQALQVARSAAVNKEPRARVFARA